MSDGNNDTNSSMNEKPMDCSASATSSPISKDESIHRRQQLQQQLSASNSSSNSIEMKKKNSVTAGVGTKSSSIRTRMETPIGERPAARVIRSSKGRPIVSTRGATSSACPITDDDDERKDEEERRRHMPPEPVVGDIIERPRRRRNKMTPNNVTKVGSINDANATITGEKHPVDNDPNGTKKYNNSPSSSLNDTKNDNNSDSDNNNIRLSGFPSVHVPLGTFVSSRNADAGVIPPPTGKSSNNINHQDDAQAMLSNMSINEIQDSIQELKQTLSPDMIEFIKNRKRSKNLPKNNNSTNSNVNNSTSTTPSILTIVHNSETVERKTTLLRSTTSTKISSNTTINESSIPSTKPGREVKNTQEQQGYSDAEMKEKLRIATVLSSIRTYDDLDAAYIAEMERDNAGILLEEEKNDITIGQPEIVETKSVNSEQHDDDFMIACQLLRSTSKRQNLWAARIVCNYLQNYCFSNSHRYYNLVKESKNASSKQQPKEWPFPVLLPISLRCLLDEPLSLKMASTCSRSGLLHAYVLKSIYSLLLLRAPVDHVVNVRYGGYDETTSDKSNNIDASMIYQLYYMDDAIPKPSLRECYSGTTVLKPLVTTASGDSTNNPEYGGVYSTGSSSRSALTDGEEFLRDPMWTLLSKMMIIPRLAQILQWNIRLQKQQPPDQQHSTSLVVADETIISICGILSMISQRSPGAASAIVQHSTLLHDLSFFSLFMMSTTKQQNRDDALNDTVPPSSSGSYYNSSIATPFFIFMATVSRQSRIAAESVYQKIDINSIIVRILTTSVTSASSSVVDHDDEQQRNDYYRLQQWALILWRIMLRYGLSLSIIPTMLTVSAAHFIIGKSNSIDQRQQGQQIAPTVDGVNRMLVSSYSLATEFYSCFTVLLCCINSLQLASEHNNNHSLVNNGIPTEEQSAILSKACVWLSASKRQAMIHLLQIKPEDLTSPDKLTYITSILRYVDWLQKVTMLTDNAISDNDTEDYVRGEFKVVDDISLTEEVRCVDLLVAMLQCNEMNSILDIVCYSARCVDFDNDGSLLGSSSRTSTVFEAAACAFFESMVGLINTMLKKTKNEGTRSHKLNDLATVLADSLKARLDPSEGSRIISDGTDDMSERVTAERCVFSSEVDLPRRHVLNMTHTAICSFAFENGNAAFKATVRSVACTLLGRLERGEERTAAILFSYDDLFSNERLGDEHDDRSLLSEMLVRELCQTPETRTQLDHSFRLHNGPGITATDLGPFKLDSLLSECDFGGAPGSTTVEQVLPLGMFWPWKLLSGSFVESDSIGKSDYLCNEFNSILLATFRMIDEIEASYEYTRRLSAGGKLYYLMNICLLPEKILSNEKVHNLAEHFFDRYYAELVTEQSILSFVEECSRSCSKFHATKSSNDDDNPPSKLRDATEDAKVQAILDSENFAESTYSNSDVRALITFFGDLCDAFLEYGVPYRFFTKSVRIFLTKWFPTKVRCEVIRRLRDALHLLSLNDDDDSNPSLLGHYVLGGIPSVDKSLRDTPDLMDNLSSLFSKSSARIDNPQMLLTTVCVATLARSVVISVDMDGVGLAVSKRRISSLDISTACLVMEASFRFLSTDGTLNSLVQVTNHVCAGSRGERSVREWFAESVDDDAWKKAIQCLQKLRK